MREGERRRDKAVEPRPGITSASEALATGSPRSCAARSRACDEAGATPHCDKRRPGSLQSEGRCKGDARETQGRRKGDAKECGESCAHLRQEAARGRNEQLRPLPEQSLPLAAEVDAAHDAAAGGGGSPRRVKPGDDRLSDGADL